MIPLEGDILLTTMNHKMVMRKDDVAALLYQQ